MEWPSRDTNGLVYKIQGNFLSIFLCIGRYPASRGFAWLLAFIIPSQWRSRFVYALKTSAASRLLFALCMCYELATRGIFSSLTKRKERSRVFGTVTDRMSYSYSKNERGITTASLRHNSQLWTCKQWTRPPPKTEPTNLIKTSVLVYMRSRVLEGSNRSNNSTLTELLK